MSQIILLRQALKPHLAWHGARLAFLAAFLISLLRVKTINLSEIATGFGGKAHIESHYKRIHRFFRHFEVDEIEIAKAVIALMDIPHPWVLSVDQERMAIWRTYLQYPDARGSASRSSLSPAVAVAR